MTTLRIGTTDHTSTAALQRRLAERGHNPGPVDGLYGLRTAAAVAGFQRAEGLTVDGVAGPVTLGALGLLDGPAAPEPDSAPATQPTGANPGAAYLTPLDAIAAPRWVQTSPGVQLTVEPLRDARTGLYARLTYQGALDACASLGATLATPQDIIALRDDAAAGRAVQLPPVTLPTVAMVRATGCQAQPGTAHFESAAQGLRVAHMRSEAWCRRHDDAVAAHLAAARWDGAQRVSGAGKHWVAGAPSGRAYLMGWWTGSAWIQPPPLPGSRGPHDRGHTDYATTTIARREAPGPERVEWMPSPNFSVGRPAGPPRIIVLHTTENPCAPGVARAVASYLARPSTQASAHYVIGPDACIQQVADENRAWHVGAPANAFTLGIEQTGFARYTAEEWSTPNARAMLDRVVARMAALCQRWAIPAVVLSAADVRAGRAGIATHAAIGHGVGGTNHWDPGPGYPLADVVARVAALTRTQP